MRKITLLLVSTIIAFSLNAQTFTQQQLLLGEKVDNTPMVMTKAIEDTLGMYEFFSSTTIYYSFGLNSTNDQINVGSVSGTCYILDSVAGTVVGDPSTYVYQNKYWTEEVGMGFDCPLGYFVYGVFWMPSLAAGPGTSSLTFNLYNIDATTTSFGGTTISCPGTLESSVNISWSQIDTNGVYLGHSFNYVPFNNPVNINMDFVLSIELTDCYNNGDTLYTFVGDDAALFGLGTDYSWFRLGSGFSISGQWVTYDDLFYGGTDLGLSIFAVVGPDTTGVETNFYQGVKLGNVYPNPSIAGSNTKIDFELEIAGEVYGYILDINGKVIQEFDEGMLSAGKHTLSLDNNLPAASYICSIFTNGQNSSQIFIVE